MQQLYWNIKKNGFFTLRRWLALILLAVFLVPLPAGANTGNWWAEYYANTNLAGAPVLSRWDNAVNFDWGGGAPGAGVPADNFSVRWSRTEWFDSGTYRFYARADDGFRLRVGDLLVFDSWVDQQGGWITRDLYLSGGSYQVKAEYYENQGGALVNLSWERIGGGSGWQAEYFANQNLSGSPTVTRNDSAIDFAWGSASPHASIPADHFSVRWTRSLNFTAGTYRFFTSSDDGIRVWVDGQLVVDAWYNQGLPNTHLGDKSLGAGLHQLKVEYFENGGEAHAHVWWQQISTGNFAGWKGEYYDNNSFSGGPALIRDDSEINFDWGVNPPISGMPNDQFSVRWTRQINFSPGYYRFSVRSDDGIRVWLDNGLVIDKWYAMDNEYHTVDGIYLTGAHQLKVEYFELTGYARVRFWVDDSGTVTPQPNPAGVVVVDDGDPGFVTGGAATSWRSAAVGYGGHLTWTRNNDYARPNHNWARWLPNLAPGNYEVFVYIPPQYANTRHANYWIKYAGNYTLRTIDQSPYYGQWVSLGTYPFSGDGSEYVELSDITNESYLSRMIAFDAIKWERR